MSNTLSIDRKLNLVLPIERGQPTALEDGTRQPNIAAYVFSLPIGEAAFKMNYKLIAKTFTKISSGGYGMIAGPRMAAILMEETSGEMGDNAAYGNLRNEINRLSMFASMTDKGWQQIPLAEAYSKKLLDEDEASEVENALAFFTVGSSMYRKSENRGLMLGMALGWGASPTSSSFTEFLASLKTSTVAAPTTEKKQRASSVPR